MQRYLLGILFVISCFLCSQDILSAANQGNKAFTIVIDPGHGGKDVGAVDNGVMEKNINLKVAKQLESLIKKRMKDVKVVMTRDNDTYLTLQQRADVANKAHGDIFISIHTNSVDKKNKNRKSVAGSSVYTLGLHKDENNLQVAMRENSVIELESNYEQKYSGFDPQKDESYIIFEMAQKKNLSQSIKLAESIENHLEKAGRQNRGVHQAGFWVLWATSMPAVLVELDFICNPESAKYMNSDKGVKELAQAIFNAVEKYGSGSSLTAESIHTDGQSDAVAEDEGIGIAKTRKKKTAGRASDTSVYAADLNPAQRKRRSMAAREKSANTLYEYEALRVSPKLSSGVVVLEEGSGNELLAEASLKQNEKTASTKAKSKEEKKKKEKQQKIAENKEKGKKNNSHNAKVNKLVTVYKIQVLASSDLLNQSNARFCGLSPISTYKENNLYKYYYGESTDRRELETVLADVKKKIPDAFIVSSTKSVQSN